MHSVDMGIGVAPEYKVLFDKIISGHGIVAFATDTVNGIGCSPYDRTAIKKLISIKGRDGKKGLPVLVSGVEAARRIGYMDRRVMALAGAFWPGGLTLLVPTKDARICRLVAQDGKIGLRMPDNRIALDVARLFGGAVVGTSANRSGEEPLTTVRGIASELPGVDLVVTPLTKRHSVPSTVFDTARMEVVRRGAITETEIRNFLEETP